MRGIPPGNCREFDLVNIAYASLRGQGEDEGQVLKSWVDISQSVARKPWGALRTFTTSSQIYSFKEDRLLVPEEHFRLLGFGENLVCGNLGPDELRKLAGEAMCVPCIALLVWSVLLAASFDGLWSSTPRAGGSGSVPGD